MSSLAQLKKVPFIKRRLWVAFKTLSIPYAAFLSLPSKPCIPG